jgi:hypothetical protein
LRQSARAAVRGTHRPDERLGRGRRPAPTRAVRTRQRRRCCPRDPRPAGQLHHARQDFDGQPAEVTVTPTGPNTATYSLTFGPDAVNYGALAISVAGDYLSTSASFAANPATAARLASQLDDAARRKLSAAGLR